MEWFSKMSEEAQLRYTRSMFSDVYHTISGVYSTAAETGRCGVLRELARLRTVLDGQAFGPSLGSRTVALSAAGGHLECLRFLVEEAGADPGLEVMYHAPMAGGTPLEWAMFHGQTHAVQYLLNTGRTNLAHRPHIWRLGWEANLIEVVNFAGGPRKGDLQMLRIAEILESGGHPLMARECLTFEKLSAGWAEHTCQNL